jgi:hypothetical protein
MNTSEMGSNTAREGEKTARDKEEKNEEGSSLREGEAGALEVLRRR